MGVGPFAKSIFDSYKGHGSNIEDIRCKYKMWRNIYRLGQTLAKQPWNLTSRHSTFCAFVHCKIL